MGEMQRLISCPSGCKVKSGRSEEQNMFRAMLHFVYYVIPFVFKCSRTFSLTPPPHPIVFSLLEQFLMYIDSVGLDGPMDMETDGPLLDDVGALKKTVEEEATQVRKTDVSVTESIIVITTCSSST